MPNIRKVSPSVIFLVFAFLPLTWFKSGHLINHNDFVLPLDPIYIFKTHMYTWFPIYSYESAVSLTNLFPWDFYFAFFQAIGISLYYSERLLFMLLFALPGYFMYVLVREVLNKSYGEIAGVFAGLFYMMNLYTLQVRWSGVSLMANFGYAFLPLFFYFYYRGLKNKNWKTYGILGGLTSLLFASSASTPTYIVVVWLIIFLYFIVYTVVHFNKSKSFHTIRYTLYFISVYFLFNLWWILPTISTLPTHFSTTFVEGAGGGHTELSYLLENRIAQIVNVFRMLSHWGFFGAHYGDPYYYYADVYISPIFIFITILIPVTVIASLIIFPKNESITAFGVVCIVSLFLVKGTNPPMGEVYRWLFLNVPFFRIFRMQFDKFGIMLTFSYSILLGCTLGFVYDTVISRRKLTIFSLNKFYNKKRQYVSSICFIIMLLLIFVAYPFPFYTGDVIREETEILKGGHFSAPSYYEDAGNWVNQDQTHYKILLLPFRKEIGGGGSTFAYRWGYAGTEISKYYMHKPFVVNRQGPAVLNDNLYLNVIGLNKTEYATLWGLQNIRYILVSGDYDVSVWPTEVDSPEEILGVLNASNLTRKKSFGELHFYEIKNFSPKVYSPTKVFFFNNLSKIEQTEGAIDELDSMSMIAPEEEFNKRSFKGQQIRLRIEPRDIKATHGFFNNKGWKKMEVNSIPEMATYYKGVPNATISYSVYIPADGEYALNVTLREYISRGSLSYRVDDGDWSKPYMPPERSIEDKKVYGSHRLGESFFGKGNHTITFKNTLPIHGDGNQELVSFTLKHQNESIELKSIPKIPTSQWGLSLVKQVKLAEPPEISFEKKSPIKYKVDVESTRPYYLALLEGFDPGWQVYEGDVAWYNVIFMNPIQTHFKANLHANGWYTDKTGKHEVTLYFFPQVYFYIGLIISSLAILIGGIYFIGEIYLRGAGMQKQTKEK